MTTTTAQLPIELYSISPTSKATGISFSQSWTLGTADATLDGYWGISDSHFRFFMRDDLTAFGGPPGRRLSPTRIDSRGLALTLQRQDTTLPWGFTRRRHPSATAAFSRPIPLCQRRSGHGGFTSAMPPPVRPGYAAHRKTFYISKSLPPV